MNKKALGPVIAISLLVIVSVVSVIGFQNWYGGYQSKTFSDVEIKSDSKEISIEKIVGTTIFIKNSIEDNYTINKFKVGNDECNLNKNLSLGINSIDISECFINSNSDIEEIIIDTHNGIFSEKIYLGEINIKTYDVVLSSGSRSWSDNSNASTCSDYLNPSFPYFYSGDIGDGNYTIDPDGAGGDAPFIVYCDMTTDGGGWMLASNYDVGGTSYLVDKYDNDLSNYMFNNILNMEFRAEVHTSTRVYKKFLQNYRLDGVNYFNHNKYFARCKQNWSDSYLGDDWGLNTSLKTGIAVWHVQCSNKGSGNSNHSIMTQCHNSLTAEDGSNYYANFNTYYSISNSYSGGLYMSPTDIWSTGSGQGHTFSIAGPEGFSHVNYNSYISDKQYIKYWIK